MAREEALAMKAGMIKKLEMDECMVEMWVVAIRNSMALKSLTG